MQPAQLIVTILLTAVIVVAAISAAAASLIPGFAEAHAGNGWRAHRSGGYHDGTDRCARLDFPMGGVAGVVIQDHLDLDEDQRARLQPMLDIVESWRTSTRDACQRLNDADIAGHLDVLEQVLRRSAGSVAELKPAYAAFYEGLGPEQRAHLDKAMSHHHGQEE
jgi:hypothetical protein